MVPQYASEADPDNPRECLAWLLTQWPRIEGSKTQPYPPPPRPLIPEYSRIAYELGFRYHPELATLKKVPGKDGKPVFISVDEPDPIVEDAGDSTADTALQMLAALSPEAAQRIAAMSDAERREVLGSQYENYVEAVAVIEKMGSLFGVK